MTTVFKSTEARPMPGRSTGPVAWLRGNLFSTPSNSLMSLALLAVCLWALVSSLDWAVLQAVFSSNLQACNEVRGAGACWGVISEKGRLIVMGRYPEVEHWRPVIATALMLGVVVISCMPRFWNKALPLIWLVMLTVYFVLMKGGFFGLTEVDTDQWGGLPLTVMLTVISMTLAFPLAIFVALGRRSNMPAIKTLCTLYVELVRGVPLITVLFMANTMLPLFLPGGWRPDSLLRVLVGVSLFAAAYMAEVVRGGLQAIPKGQYEGAMSLGVGYWQMMGLVILPQALKIVIPNIVNTFIGLFKDTSLVSIVGIFDLVKTVEASLVDPRWATPVTRASGYAFAALFYFVFCFGMSQYSQWMERRLATGHKH